MVTVVITLGVMFLVYKIGVVVGKTSVVPSRQGYDMPDGDE